MLCTTASSGERLCNGTASVRLSVRRSVPSIANCLCVCIIVFRCWSYVGFTGYLNQTVSIGNGCQSVSFIGVRIPHIGANGVS